MRTDDDGRESQYVYTWTWC